MSVVVDASALLAYLRSEKGAEVVEVLLMDGETECHAHAVNLCEVYYDTVREFGRTRALAAVELLMQAGANLRDDMDPDYWQSVGDYKAPGGVSLADCFCIALSNRLGADVVTADRHEFEPLAAKGVCTPKFIR